MTKDQMREKFIREHPTHAIVTQYQKREGNWKWRLLEWEERHS